MLKVPPMMFTVPTPRNIFEARCVSLVDWVVDCCGLRRLMNARNLCRKSILVVGTWWFRRIIYL